MTTSDWGDWLPRAVDEADPDGVAAWYLGCNGFFLKASDGTTVLVDPYVGTGSPPRTIRMIPVPFDPDDVEHADAVFATHEHTDHVDEESQAPVLEAHDATYYAPDDSLDVVAEEGWREDYDVSEEQFVEVTEGDTLEVGSFTVHVVETDDVDATHPVGYVFEHEAGTFFHAGDSKPSDSFSDVGERFDIDAGALAFGTVGNVPDKETGVPKRTRWYNDENQIIECASDLQLDRLVPTHYDMWKGLTSDPKVLHHHAKSFDYPADLEIVEIGDRFDL
ncbi:MBL fold metallo-hydrolase [Halarchaeum sp. P4]|uniref:MBL fold metallo-hydrolase n=1 Tax=Halarchaeum sp. P4 TaxID=3421639 RepID=UPI003EB993D0